MADKMSTKHHLKFMPVRCVAFAERDAEVDGVRERMIPVSPVVRADSVVAADVTVERPNEHHVCVYIDAAVLYHEVDAPYVSHMRQYVHYVAVHLAPYQPNTLYCVLGN